jgi:hypothetical protein
MELIYFFRIIFKRKWIILAAGLAGVVAAFLLTKYSALGPLLILRFGRTAAPWSATPDRPRRGSPLDLPG